MPADYRTWSSRVRQLDRGLAALGSMAASVGVWAPAGQSWYELLRRKLLPQLDVEPLLVVGIVGGTNIGKSLLFNHLAGEVASGVSPLAAGTKHPICLVPTGLDDPALLTRLFDGFDLRRWESAECTGCRTGPASEGNKSYPDRCEKRNIFSVHQRWPKLHWPKIVTAFDSIEKVRW